MSRTLTIKGYQGRSKFFAFGICRKLNLTIDSSSNLNETGLSIAGGLPVGRPPDSKKLWNFKLHTLLTVEEEADSNIT